MEKNIPIYNGKVANELLKKGYTIKNLAPNKNYPQRTVFFFKNDNGFFDDLSEISKKYRDISKTHKRGDSNE